MKQKSKVEIGNSAKKCYSNYVACYGLSNAERVLKETLKMIRAKRKEMKGKKP